jgi:tRNA threonylcarbamoyladenosine biosynthesis protein TsaE
VSGRPENPGTSEPRNHGTSSTRVTHSEGETASIGRDLGRRLQAGDVVLLEGALGAGKTAFARGLAEGLGCDAEDVSSPTFTIVQEYRGTTRLQHVDLYRLTPVEVDDLALEDLLEESVVAVEWPERWHRAPARATRVTIEILDGTRRRITIESQSSSEVPSSQF